MDISRFFVILCAFLLLVCLTFSITALVSLRHVVAENRALQNETTVLIEKIKKENETKQDSVSVSTNQTPTNDTKQDGTRYCLKSVCGILGVFTEQGEPIRMLDTKVDLLPFPDRKNLEAGIYVDTWTEMLTLIQDYAE